MAKIPTLTQNPDELRLFSKVLTPKQTKNGFKISFHTGKVSTRRKRANRANTPGYILKLLNEQIRAEDLQGWKDFAESIGVRWSVASLFIAGALKKNKMADVGEIRNGLLRLGGATGVSQAPAPVGFFNTYLRIIRTGGSNFNLIHLHPQTFVLREKDPNLKKVFRNRIISMGTFRKLKMSFDYRGEYAWLSNLFTLRVFESEDCTGWSYGFDISPSENGHFELETTDYGIDFHSFQISINIPYNEYWFEIDNLSVRNGGIELMIDPGFEYYDRNQRGIFRAQLPMWDFEASGEYFQIEPRFENKYVNNA